MKIVRITTLLNFGGQEKQYLTFTENKSILNHQYIFAAIGHGGFAEKIIRERGFEVKIFNLQPSIYNLKNIFILYKWFKKIKPNIVHTAAAEANFHGVIAAKLANVKYIIAEEIGYPTHSRTAKIIFKITYNLVDRVICVSNSVKEFLVAIKEIKPNKGIVVYNPVSCPKIVSKKSTSDVFTIVSVGRLEKVKNMQLLIYTFSKLNLKEKAKLIIVGDGSEKQHLEDIINELNLKESITITGFLSEPETIVSQADLFILPSLAEGFGIAVVEAMLQHIPCLCSNVGGIPEFIEDGLTGWLFDPLNEFAFENKLTEIISFPKSKLIQVAENGYKNVLNSFTLEKYIERVEKLYQKEI